MVLIQSGEFNNCVSVWLFIGLALSCVCLWFLNLEIVPSVSTQNILLSSNDLEDLLGNPEDESFLSFGRTVSRMHINC